MNLQIGMDDSGRYVFDRDKLPDDVEPYAEGFVCPPEAIASSRPRTREHSFARMVEMAVAGTLPSFGSASKTATADLSCGAPVRWRAT